MGMRLGWKTFWVLMIVWIVGSVLGSWFTIQAWVYGGGGGVRPLGNLAWIVSLPGWATAFVAHQFGIGSGRSDVSSIVIANVTGWGYLVVGAGVLWMIRGWLHLGVREEHTEDSVNQSRRAFLTNSTFGGVAIAAAGAPGYATLVEPWSIKVRRYSVPIDGLPESLRGLKIAQVSDTHLGPRIPESFVVQAYQMAMDLEPDLIVLTGDHVHDGTREYARAAELCKPMVERCPMGVLSVLGNHDWWGGGVQLSALLSEAGVRMIDNDRVWIDSVTRRVVNHDPGAGSLSLVGIGDLTDGVVDVGRAFRGVDPSSPRIVLAHNPDTAEIDALARDGSHRVDLMISGHTHGGQVKIPLVGTPIVPSGYGQKYAGGLVDGPRFRVCVSRGIGMSMLPVRVGVPPEISLIELV
jgi:uncharacterized protein